MPPQLRRNTSIEVYGRIDTSVYASVGLNWGPILDWGVSKYPSLFPLNEIGREMLTPLDSENAKMSPDRLTDVFNKCLIVVLFINFSSSDYFSCTVWLVFWQFLSHLHHRWQKFPHNERNKYGPKCLRAHYSCNISWKENACNKWGVMWPSIWVKEEDQTIEREGIIFWDYTKVWLAGTTWNTLRVWYRWWCDETKDISFEIC